LHLVSKETILPASSQQMSTRAQSSKARPAPRASRTSAKGRSVELASPKVSGLEAHVGFWLRFVSNHVSRRFARLMQANGVTVSEWVALRRLHAAGVTAPTELIDTLGMTKGAISKILARLEAKGLVAREHAEEDRRAQRIALTPSGRQLVPRLAALADANDALFFGHLPRAAREQLVLNMMDIVRIHQLRDVPVD
jgi:DNA-binding MarR family transcriptional regulator